MKSEKRYLAEAAADSPEVDVLYEVTSKTLNMKTITNSLDSAISSGEYTSTLNTDLVAAGVADMKITANIVPMIVDSSPTSEPTRRPTRAPIEGTFSPTPLPTLEVTQVMKNILYTSAHRIFASMRLAMFQVLDDI